MCSLGRELDDACKLDFVPPLQTPEGKICAHISREEINHNVLRWNNTLVGYVLGNRPFYSHLKACVTRLWHPTCSLEIHSRENSFFVKFGTEEEC